ncbi:major facilitator superfamily domain-containing protein [Echria macrotheca]|uniref:Major facilitator superfamily domain-containing protein n=1 Tax=Echria macrotheca TaxID=438768 RepID=A0AAJ0B5W2_9PEZI|nr:major facilitator superfamily domain-containing protein [Echria macrotheca]
MGTLSSAVRRGFIFGHTKSATSPRKPPRFLAFRSSAALITSTVCLAIFTDTFLYGLTVPVIPFSLTVQVGVPDDQVQHWNAILLAVYNAALCVGSPVIGLYADHSSSRRMPLLAGLLALAGATLLLCLGKTVSLLVVGRLLQGLSAAVVWSVGLALLVDTVGKDIGRSMGYVTIAIAIGLLISPVIGGAIYANAGYYAVYYIAFGIICCDIALRLLIVEKKVARQWLDPPPPPPPMDGRPASCDRDAPPTSPGGGGGSSFGDAPPPPAADESVGGSAEKRRRPLLELITHSLSCLPVLRPIGRVVAVRICICICMWAHAFFSTRFACDTVVPLFVKDVFHWNSTAAGLVFICIMVPGFASPLVGMLADRYGARWPAAAGFALSIPLLICLRFVTQDTLGHKVLLCALLTLLGTTILAFANTPLMAAMSYAIDAKEARQPGIWGEKGVYGIAYGLWTTGFALGGTIGSLMAGYINAGPGWGTLTWSLAIWCVPGVVLAFWLGSTPRKKNADTSPTTAENMSASAPT